MYEEDLTLTGLWRVLLRERWWVVACTLLGGVLGAAYAISRAPQYESQALLSSAQEDSSQMAAFAGLIGQFGGLANAMNLRGAGGASVDETVAVLTSRDFTDRFLRRHAVLQYLYPERWDSKQSRWKQGGDEGFVSGLSRSLSEAADRLAGTRPGSSVGVAGSGMPGEPSMEKALERFAKLRTVTIDRRTGFMMLSVRAPTATLARDWADATIADVNQELKERALGESRKTVEVLARRMQDLQFESVRSAAAMLMEGQLRREVLAQVRPDFALKVLDPPSLPEHRVYPKRIHIVLIWSILGFGLGVVAAVLRRAWVGQRGKGGTGE